MCFLNSGLINRPHYVGFIKFTLPVQQQLQNIPTKDLEVGTLLKAKNKECFLYAMYNVLACA